ncbi:MAG TPA: outer membrane protein assembly factor BamE [Oleiagrimonas sp.]|nr:outer membrane protein assembly factor BamE [Oleiagrimonas sp.]
MRTLLHSLTCTLLATALAGCGLVYHPPLQQGNLLDKETVAKLKPGMTQHQVITLMGTPSVTSPFSHDRWNYVHEFAAENGDVKVRTLKLFFDNGTLTRTEGSLFAANNSEMLEQAQMYQKAGTDNGKAASDKPSGESN